MSMRATPITAVASLIAASLAVACTARGPEMEHKIGLVYFGPDSSFTGGTTDSTTMYTAVSADGINFIEEGAIYTSSGETITDRDLF